MNESAQPLLEPSLADYFRRRLAEHARQLDTPPQEDTCWYVGNLLARFGRSDHLFAYHHGRFDLRPLALLYGDALAAGTQRERCLLLQQLGDMALFLGALFPERFTRRGIGSDYVVGMGGGAYDFLAEHAPRRQRHVFADLARTFARVIELVAHACSRPRRLGMVEIVDLYQRWLDTRDPLLAGQLQALGIDLSGSARLQ